MPLLSVDAESKETLLAVIKQSQIAGTELGETLIAQLSAREDEAVDRLDADVKRWLDGMKQVLAGLEGWTVSGSFSFTLHAPKK